MPPLIRRSLFYLFVALFFVSAILTFFYQSGYRYHFVKHKIEKTGQIVIVAKPRDVSVTLNDEHQTYWWQNIWRIRPLQKEIRVDHLLSGTYTVALKKEGYYDWNTQTSVVPGQSSILAYAELLHRGDTLDQVVDDKNIEEFIVNDSKKYIVWRSGVSVGIYDSETKKTTNTVFPGPVQSVQVSPEGEDILVKTTVGWFTFNRAKHQPKAVPDSMHFLKMGWAYGDVLFATDKTSVYLVTPSGTIVRLAVFQEGVRDSIVVNKDIYVLSGTDVRRVWQLANMQAVPPQLVGAADKGAESFAVGSSDALFFVRGQKKTVLFYQNGNRKSSINLGDIGNMTWLAHDHFIAWNDFEVWEYVVRGGVYDRRFITRQGVRISNIFAPKDSPYLFIQLDGQGILALEYINELGNAYVVDGLGKARQCVLATASQELYCLQEKEKARGVWKWHYSGD